MNLKNKPLYSWKGCLAAISLGALSPSISSAQIVAGWDNFSGSGADDLPVDAPIVADGVTATFVTTGEGRNWIAADARGSSSDGTWGTLVGPPAADTTVGGSGDPNLNLELSNAAPGGTITITLNNNSGADINLDAFHMDALAFRPKAARTYTLDVLPGGAITAGNVYTSGEQEIRTTAGLPPDNDQADDIDHDLTGLSDSTLENGGTIEFLLTFSGGAGDGSGGHDLWIDNLAISSSSAGSNQLAITTVPASVTAGTDFSITVEAQDGSGTPLAGGVSQDTEILLATPTGTGTLSGHTATIPMGANSITLTSVQYTVAEDITLIASQTSGDLLVPSDESSVITISAGPASVLSVESAIDGSGEMVGNTSFRVNFVADTLDVFAIARDSVGNFISHETNAVFTLENITGALEPADLVDNLNGSATFTAQNLGTGVIRAAVAGLPNGDSGIITVEEPQFRWVSQGNGSWGPGQNWLDSISPFFDNTTDLYFVDEYAITAQTFLNGDRTVRSLNFTEFADPTVTQPAFGIRYLFNNTPGAAANLTMDTDSLDGPAEINVAMGAEININLGNVNNGFIPDLPENYGNLILADPIQITHQGTGSLIFSRPIVEVEEPMSVTIHESTTGTVSFIAANTYTGPTTVRGGTLRLLNGNAISDDGTLVIDGGIIDVQEDENVGKLFIGGTAKAPGVYGSSLSLAPVENQDDERFSGPGTVTVLGFEAGDLEIKSIDFDGTIVTLTWNSTPGTSFTVFFSSDLEDFGFDVEDGIPADEESNLTTYSFPVRILGADVDKAFFRVVQE
ncbi:MAG: hypothetical protein ACON38_19340 [Akkermansiaceae bacterium]